MISFQETVRRLRRRLDRLVGRQDDHRLAEHYRELMERHLANANLYQGLLFHAWKCNKQQTKGLQRQAMKIKRLQKLLPPNKIIEGLEPNGESPSRMEGST